VKRAKRVYREQREGTSKTSRSEDCVQYRTERTLLTTAGATGRDRSIAPHTLDATPIASNVAGLLSSHP
jgi:hypothetical protein